MRLTRLSLALLLAAPLLPAATPPAAAQDPTRSIDAEQIRAHLAFLADDLLEGRAPGTRGERLAANYIASQLARSGVPSLRGSYLQSVPLVGWRPDPRRISFSATTAAGRVTLRYPADAVLWLDNVDSTTVTAELVFVGYGVVAPEFQWDDYKDRDVSGKVVVALISDPPAPPGQPLIFDGPATTYYGRWTYKVEEAARRGAAAVLLIHNDEGAGYPWRVIETSWTREQLALPSAGDSTTSRMPMQGWITTDAARRLLDIGELDFNELFVRAARRDFHPVPTRIQLRLHAGGRTREIEATNVVGVVPGRHATRRAEAVVYTAHYDHLGVGPAVDRDSIYNGAYDNASGAALLLEIAEAFASLPAPPERSVVFLFPTAEEAGLLGAKYYVQHPLVPIDRTIAVLNIDGANLWGETDDASAVGLERSTLGLTFETHAGALGLRVIAERAPDKGFFFRSDHFPFARAGVPALFFDHGLTFRNRPPGWGEATLARYDEERYHMPGDEYDPSFDLSGAVQQGRLAFLIGHDVANAPQPPRWYRGGTVSTTSRTRSQRR